MKPTSLISSTLASSIAPSKLSTKALRFVDQARARIGVADRCRRARSRTAPASASPRRPAIFASRSQAAQHIRLDEVWTRAPRAQLPDAGIGLVVELEGPLADEFELGEIRRAGRHEQPLVEERRRRRQDQVAVGVVLEMLVGLIADPHRPHAAIAGQVIDGALGELAFER